jgi:hypothetical protein
VFTQKSDGGGDMTANGKLDDGQGRTGSWKFTSDAELGDAGWTETGRQFHHPHIRYAANPNPKEIPNPRPNG